MQSINTETESFLKLIQSRRTCYQFLAKENHPIEKQKLQNCLQAAIWAPNHKLTQPWIFWVVGDEIKPKLADIYADNRATKKSQIDPDCYDYFYDKALQKFLAIPQVVLVGQRLSENEVVKTEDYAACACAIQNFQLIAWQQNIGVQWSTGPIINDIRTYQTLDIELEKIQIIGALYMGNIDENCQPKIPPKRKLVDEVTIYLK